MEKRRIDLTTFPRREHFLYFSSLQNPTMGATVQVDVTDFLKTLEDKGYPFFLSFLYVVTEAVNAVPELRQRIEDGGIVEYAYSKPSCTVLKPDGTYAYCSMDGRMTFAEFLRDGRERMEAAKAGGSLEESEDAASEIFISCLPWMSYTDLVQPMGVPADSNVRITWGKYTWQGERCTIPVTFLAHHALVDGLHMGRFYEILAEKLKHFL